LLLCKLGNTICSALTCARCTDLSGMRSMRSPTLLASGGIVRLARCSLRRPCLSLHGTQGRLAQRLGQRPVRPECFHDCGRVVLLPPQLLDQPVGLGAEGRGLTPRVVFSGAMSHRRILDSTLSRSTSSTWESSSTGFIYSPAFWSCPGDTSPARLATYSPRPVC
jgi:hypothetical protein